MHENAIFVIINLLKKNLGRLHYECFKKQKEVVSKKVGMVLSIILILIICNKINNFIENFGLKEVPNVMGLNYQDAITVLKEKGFKVTAIETDVESILSESAWNRSVKKGVVFSVNGNTYPRYSEKTKDKKITIYYADNDYIYEEPESNPKPEQKSQSDIEPTTSLPISDNNRPEKDGFDQHSNKNYDIGSYTFSIPDYWIESESSSDRYLFYAETNGKTAMLAVTYGVDEEDEVSLDTLYADNDNIIAAIEGWFDECKITDYRQYQSQSDITGMIYDYTYSQNIDNHKYSGTGKCFNFPCVQNNQWYFVILAVTDNTEYTYNNDYNSILESIKSSTNANNTVSDEIRPEFKEALDSYEAFFDEYITFMKKYAESNNPISMLTDYTSYMTQYIDMMDKLDKLDDGDLNNAEILYYAEVSARINQKLLEVALQ